MLELIQEHRIIAGRPSIRFSLHRPLNRQERAKFDELRAQHPKAYKSRLERLAYYLSTRFIEFPTAAHKSEYTEWLINHGASAGTADNDWRLVWGPSQQAAALQETADLQTVLFNSAQARPELRDHVGITRIIARIAFWSSLEDYDVPMYAGDIEPALLSYVDHSEKRKIAPEHATLEFRLVLPILVRDLK